MIEINLLPEELRKKKQFQFDLGDLQKGKVKFIGGGALLGVLILLVLFFSVGASIRKGQSANLLAREEGLREQKSQVETISKDISILNAKMATLDEITKTRFLWARKLNQLSDLVLPGTWFTHVYIDSEKTLIIEGSVISKKEEAMALVGKFMKDIRGHEDFFKDFSNIKLESVQRETLDKRDVVDFKIALYF